MKLNKKAIIILIAIIVILLIIATIAIIINNKKGKEFKETAVLSEFINEENVQEENIIVAITENPQETIDIPNINNEAEQNKNEENKSTQSSTYDGDYYIKVNNQANVVTIYQKDSLGNYTIPVKAMVCSIGTATPKNGVYSTTNKYQWRLLVGNVYGQYATRIVGSILFHSVPYLKQDPSTLEYWEYDKLGTSASAGCVRLTVADAKWIYDNCKSGTKVEFYSDANPGPLGKPTAKKISNEDENVRIWDPTDSRDNNPWKIYNPNKIKDEKNNLQIENKQNENNTVLEEVNNTINNNTTNNNNITSNKKEETNVIKDNMTVNTISNQYR